MQPSQLKALALALQQGCPGVTHGCREQGQESGVREVTMCGPQELVAEELCSRLVPTEAATREGSVDRLAQLGSGIKAELPSAVSPR